MDLVLDLTGIAFHPDPAAGALDKELPLAFTACHFCLSRYFMEPAAGFW